MARYIGPKNRIARRFGANVFGRARNPLAHKPHPPGQHGTKRKKKSDYGVQLEEKQKLRASYGMLSQKQLVQYYRKAVILPGNTQDVFISLLESRLDTMVYRLKFGLTIFHAQQLVSHGHILVDGKKIDRRSFQVLPGMTLSIHEKAKNNPLVKQSLERAAVEVPSYLSFDAAKLSGQLLSQPHLDQIPLPLPVNIAVVCEFLAHST
jgi:small subunit ribosomal protein S4